MAKRKLLNITEEEKKILSDIIMALTVVYGPIEVDRLIEKAKEYFPEECENKEDAMGYLIDLMSDQEVLFVSDQDELSIYTDEELKIIASIDSISVFADSKLEKHFDDPKELLKYGDVFSIKDEKYERLKNFLSRLKYKRGSNLNEAYNDALIVIYKLYDEEEYFKQLSKRTSSSYDKTYLSELMSDIGSYVPRGFLHGYSFAEIGERIASPEMFNLLQNERIEMPKNGKKYGSYTYEDCLELARRLKETNMFDVFCSDNPIELSINNKEVFVHLLGYYNGDRNLIIYGDRKNMEYNYHFITSEDTAYPDITSRVNYSEVVIDEPGGFMTPDVKKQLKKKGYDSSPLIIDLEPTCGPHLPRKKELDLIGACMDCLLQIYEYMGEKIGGFCEAQDMYHIIQLYLHEDGLSIGEYTYLELGEPVIPFKVDPIRMDLAIQAKRKGDISIGLYSIPVISEKEPSYVTYVFNETGGLMVGFDVASQEDMPKIKDRIISILESNDLRPRKLTFNNEFALQVLDELFDFYDLDYNHELGCEFLDEFYLDIITGGGDELPPSGLLH